MKHAPQPFLQSFVQCKRVQRGPFLAQFTLGRPSDLWAAQEPITGRLGAVVPSFHLRPVPILGFELHRRHEEVVLRLPNIPIQRVDGLQQSRIFEALVTQELAHPGPASSRGAPLRN